MSSEQPGPTRLRVQSALEADHFYEGERQPDAHELVVLGRARDLVSRYTYGLGYVDRANVIKNLDLGSITIHSKAGTRLTNGGVIVNNAAGSVGLLDRKVRFSQASASNSRTFLGVAVHELYHVAAADATYSAEEDDVVEHAIGIAHQVLGFENNELTEDTGLATPNEAMDDLLTMATLPEQERAQHFAIDNQYGKHRLLLHMLMHRVVEYKATQDSQFGLRDAWRMICHDYFTGSHRFIHTLSSTLEPETMDKIRRFGVDGGHDLELLSELSTEQSDEFRADVHKMTLGYRNKAWGMLVAYDRQFLEVAASEAMQ